MSADRNNVRERPIIFSAPMVVAILAGTKTQTRRIVGPSNGIVDGYASGRRAWDGPDGASLVIGHPDVFVDAGPSLAGNPGPYLHVPRSDGDSTHRVYPIWQPGDRLWVREVWTWNGGRGGVRAGEYAELWVTYAADGVRRSINPGGIVSTPPQPPLRDGEVYSLRDAPEDFVYTGENTYHDRLIRWWRRKITPIHMSRWASRILLEITEVRAQRLQEISESDAIAEGCIAHPSGTWWQGYRDCEGRLVHQQFRGDAPPDWMIEPKRMADTPHLDRSARDAYRMLWAQIHGFDSWDANPWVWAISFERIERADESRISSSAEVLSGVSKC